MLNAYLIIDLINKYAVQKSLGCAHLKLEMSIFTYNIQRKTTSFAQIGYI